MESVVRAAVALLHIFNLCWCFAELKDSDPVVLTWRAVLEKKLTCDEIGAGVTKITLPKGLKWFFNFMEPHILARACNPLLFDKMRSLKDDKTEESEAMGILTGSPGIGKSWFLMYAMYRLAAEPSVPPIILHSSYCDAAYWFKSNGTVSVISQPGGGLGLYRGPKYMVLL